MHAEADTGSHVKQTLKLLDLYVYGRARKTCNTVQYQNNQNQFIYSHIDVYR
jgi:hypothetical protein